jgi:hypothetical protein
MRSLVLLHALYVVPTGTNRGMWGNSPTIDANICFKLPKPEVLGHTPEVAPWVSE